MKKNNIVILVCLTVFFFSSCATYYQQSFRFQESFSLGDLEKAQSFLKNHEKAAEKKDRLLYFLDRGVVEQMLGNYEISNQYFEQAYTFSQDYRKNFSSDLIGMIANPMLKPYQGEDFEIVLIHFYKTINFFQLNQLDDALVEIRRVNIKLNELNDKYEGKKNRYKTDAFADNLMGIIYEAKKDYNNAFIAYRNALEGYQNIYAKEFGVEVPLQLKKDLLRMARYNDFQQELLQYEEEFGFKYQEKLKNSGDLIFFWLNGLGPVKGEFSLNLSTIKGQGGGFTFANEQEGFTIPYSSTPNYNQNNSASFGDLKVVRMAIPKYRSREPLINEAYLKVNGGKKIDLHQAENISSIAISTLQDRMLREITKSVARVAIKQAAELAVREKNEEIGALVSLANAFTEKADTRNWQTLPHSIYYQRLNLTADTHRLQLVTKGKNIPADTLSFKVDIEKNQTLFRTFHSLESTPPMNLN